MNVLIICVDQLHVGELSLQNPVPFVFVVSYFFFLHQKFFGADVYFRTNDALALPYRSKRL